MNTWLEDFQLTFIPSSDEARTKYLLNIRNLVIAKEIITAVKENHVTCQ